jgi:hypothetical protein
VPRVVQQKLASAATNGSGNGSYDAVDFAPPPKARTTNETLKSSSPREEAVKEVVKPRPRVEEAVPVKPRQRVEEVVPVKPAEKIRSNNNPFFKVVSAPVNKVPSPTNGGGRAEREPVKTAVAAPIESTRLPPKKAPESRSAAVSDKPKYYWLNARYSENLKSGVTAKVAFIYTVNKYQVSAVADDDAVYSVQDAITRHIKNVEKSKCKAS